jgi:uncharacterized protein
MGKKARNGNHLTGQTSPYLLQHAGNPVDWYPWGEEALGKARQENKPLLVSIGYSACHWCHVMERESFEDPEVARIMNAHFVCIKVDREERPDVDRLYMDAVQLVGGQGGWPLNCFALPDGKPFWGGTYFPKEQWKGILLRVAGLYSDQHAEVVEQAGRLTKGVASNGFIAPAKEAQGFSKTEVQAIYRNLLKGMDPKEGGTPGAPKFPLPALYPFLLQYHFLEGDPQGLALCRLSLEKMAMGGIYDQLGGGFARYATDDRWRIPHFEKMLYDNAQLISLYSTAWQVLGDPLYREVVYETTGFVHRELTADNGVFYSALDADSEGVEGKFYVWTQQEMDAVLGEMDGVPAQTALLIRKYFLVGEKGFWEKGLNVLMRQWSPEAFAEREGLESGSFRTMLEQARRKLWEAREKRIRPALDNKVIVSWNALMIKSLSDAYAAFQDPVFLERALHAARFILSNARDDQGRLFRKLDGTQPSIEAFLEDYALLCQALIRLYEVSMQQEFIVAAHDLAMHAESHFSLPGTNLFSFSSDESDTLAAPSFEIHDNVIPASNSVMAHNLLQLGMLFEKPEWVQRSARMLEDIGPRLKRFSPSFANWATLMVNHVYPFHTVVIAGENAGEYLAELSGRFLPGTLLAASTGPDNVLPVFAQRYKIGQTRIYVCSMGVCKQPVDTVQAALKQLGVQAG